MKIIFWLQKNEMRRYNAIYSGWGWWESGEKNVGQFLFILQKLMVMIWKKGCRKKQNFLIKQTKIWRKNVLEGGLCEVVGQDNLRMH